LQKNLPYVPGSPEEAAAVEAMLRGENVPLPDMTVNLPAVDTGQPAPPNEEMFTQLGAQPGLGVPQLQAPQLPPELATLGQRAPTPGQSLLPPGLRSISVGGGGVSVSEATPGIITKKTSPLDLDEGKFTPRARERAQSLAAGVQGQLDALRSTQEAQTQATEQLAEGRREIAEFDRIEAAAEAEIAEIANIEAQERISGISNAMEAVRSMKVDPSRVWTQGGSANKAKGLVAAFIGGFLQPVLGTNTIQATLDKAIDRDIDAQKTDIKLAQANVANLRQLHNLGLNQAATEAEQRQQDRLVRKASIVGMLEADAMQLQDDVLKQKMLGEVAKIKTDFTKEVHAIEDNIRQQAFNELKFKVDAQLRKQQVAISRRGVKLRERQLKLSEQQRQDKINAALKAEQRLLQANQVPTESGFTMNGGSVLTHPSLDTSTSHGSKKRQELNELSKKINQRWNIIEAAKKIPPGRLRNPLKEDQQLLKSLEAALFADQSLGSGVSDRDVELRKQEFGNFSKMISALGEDGVRKVMEQYQNTLELDGDTFAKTISNEAEFTPVPDGRFGEVQEDIFGQGEDPRITAPSGMALKMEAQESDAGRIGVAEEFVANVEGLIGQEIPPGDPSVGKMLDALSGIDEDEFEKPRKAGEPPPVNAKRQLRIIFEQGSGRHQQRQREREAQPIRRFPGQTRQVQSTPLNE
jgi:hypothetical protein